MINKNIFWTQILAVLSIPISKKGRQRLWPSERAQVWDHGFQSSSAFGGTSLDRITDSVLSQLTQHFCIELQMSPEMAQSGTLSHRAHVLKMSETPAEIT